MNLLDEMWTSVLREVEREAAATHNGDVANYLRLREANDALRGKAVEWLFGVFQTVAAEANRRGLAINVEKSDAHRFAVGAATMQGSLVRLRAGAVRALTVEAGSPRTPADGFIRGGGLACARISHFGVSAANEDLLLAQTLAKEAPVWFSLDKNGGRREFDHARLKQHFAVFLEMS